MSDTRQATLDLRVANAVACAASSDKSLPANRRGVLIDIKPTGTTYVATDGQILLADHRPRGAGDHLVGNLLLHPEILKEFKLTKSSNPTMFLTRVSEFSMRLTWGDKQTDFELVKPDGFPNWRGVIPENPSGEAGQYGGDNLQRLLKAGGIMGAQRIMAIGHNGGDPAIVRWSDLPSFFGLISPYRLDGDATTAAPEWLAQS